MSRIQCLIVATVLLSGCAAEKAPSSTTAVANLGTEAPPAHSFTLKAAPAPYKPGELIDSTVANPHRVLHDPKITESTVIAAAQEYLDGSRFDAATPKLLTCADARTQYKFELNRFTSDSEVWVIELHGALNPPGRAMPLDKNGNPRQASLHSGTLVVDASTGQVVKADLYP